MGQGTDQRGLPVEKCGKYLLQRELAAGGMGRVWVAFDPDLQRKVALKRLLATEGDVAVRLLKEAKIVARLQHPNVVQVFDYGMDGDTPYVVMELLEGEDLGARLQRVKCLSPDTLSSWLVQIARGLAAAHTAGIIHLDLKPSNIFLTRGDGLEETVKVLDFGTAAVRSQDQSHVRLDVVAGTPWYMSPEQIRSEALDHRSDLWSLGVLAYQSLTGVLPFDGPRRLELFFRIGADFHVPPTELTKGLSPGMDRFFERALSKKPEDRFQSAPEMAAAFSRMTGEEGTRRATILFVDDEPDMAALIEQVFQEQIAEGYYKMLFATDGVDALEKLRGNPDIDVVLSDIRMPRMSGLKFLSLASSLSPTTKVVMMSAYGDMRNVREAMNLGAFDFLVKPVNLADLSFTVDKAIRQTEEVRRKARLSRENSVLRMLVDRAVLERLTPMILGIGVSGSESADATIGSFGVRVGQGDLTTETLRDLNTKFEIVVRCVQEQQGIVAKLIGDTVLAVFSGRGHEERAVQCATSLREVLGPHLAAGLESGPMVSGAIGSTTYARLEHTILSPAFPIASFLMLNSRPNEVLVGETLGKRLTASTAFMCRFSGRAAPSRLAAEVSMYTVEPTTPSDEALSGIVPTVEILDEEP